MIEIIPVGKLKNRDLRPLIDYYIKLSSRWVKVREREIVPAQLEKVLFEKGVNILLDEKGEEMDSIEFSKMLGELLQRYGHIKFFIGEEEGFKENHRKRADRIISLSKLTFPHELVRVIIAEQIFRGLSILHHHPYHRS